MSNQITIHIMEYTQMVPYPSYFYHGVFVVVAVAVCTFRLGEGLETQSVQYQLSLSALKMVWLILHLELLQSPFKFVHNQLSSVPTESINKPRQTQSINKPKTFSLLLTLWSSAKVKVTEVFMKPASMAGMK